MATESEDDRRCGGESKMRPSRHDTLAPMIAFFRRFGDVDVFQVTSNRSYHSVRVAVGDRGLSLTVERRDRRIGLFAEERGADEHGGSWSTSPAAAGRLVRSLLPEEAIVDPDDPVAIGAYLSRHEEAITKEASTHFDRKR